MIYIRKKSIELDVNQEALVAVHKYAPSETVLNKKQTKKRALFLLNKFRDYFRQRGKKVLGRSSLQSRLKDLTEADATESNGPNIFNEAPSRKFGGGKKVELKIKYKKGGEMRDRIDISPKFEEFDWEEDWEEYKEWNEKWKKREEDINKAISKVYDKYKAPPLLEEEISMELDKDLDNQLREIIEQFSISRGLMIVNLEDVRDDKKLQEEVSERNDKLKRTLALGGWVRKFGDNPQKTTENWFDQGRRKINLTCPSPPRIEDFLKNRIEKTEVEEAVSYLQNFPGMKPEIETIIQSDTMKIHYNWKEEATRSLNIEKQLSYDRSDDKINSESTIFLVKLGVDTPVRVHSKEKWPTSKEKLEKLVDLSHLPRGEVRRRKNKLKNMSYEFPLWENDKIREVFSNILTKSSDEKIEEFITDILRCSITHALAFSYSNKTTKDWLKSVYSNIFERADTGTDISQLHPWKYLRMYFEKHDSKREEIFDLCWEGIAKFDIITPPFTEIPYILKDAVETGFKNKEEIGEKIKGKFDNQELEEKKANKLYAVLHEASPPK